MIKCKICGVECNSVSHHLKKHKMSKSQYLEKFPDAELKTPEVTESYRNATLKGFQESRFNSFLEGGKRYINSEENKERLRRQNKDPRFIESQRERLSKKMTETNLREWHNNYESCKERALKNLLWDDDRGPRSKIQKKVSDYLVSLSFSIKEEKAFQINDRLVKVDIYLLEYDLVIEVNGRYWYGDITKQSIDEMTEYQKQGYERDMIKKSYFKDDILFIWEEQVQNDDYKEIVKQFVKSRGHVKLGELLET